MRIVKGLYHPDKADLEYIDKNLGNFSIMEMCDHLLISRYALEKICLKYFPDRYTKSKRVITLEDERYIIENFPNKDNNEIMVHLDISRKTLMKIRDKFSLKKSDEFLERKERERLKRKTQGRRNVPCSGTFCENKLTCAHYQKYLELGKPKYNLLNNGWTTKCINEGNFTFYVERTDTNTTTENL